MSSKYSISYFVCPQCGKTLPLPRGKNRARNKGHIKNLYCVFCNETVKCTEIRDKDYYIKENRNIFYV